MRLGRDDAPDGVKSVLSEVPLHISRRNRSLSAAEQTFPNARSGSRSDRSYREQTDRPCNHRSQSSAPGPVRDHGSRRCRQHLMIGLCPPERLSGSGRASRVDAEEVDRRQQYGDDATVRIASGSCSMTSHARVVALAAAKVNARVAKQKAQRAEREAAFRRFLTKVPGAATTLKLPPWTNTPT
jgi:hypothetical protein